MKWQIGATLIVSGLVACTFRQNQSVSSEQHDSSAKCSTPSAEPHDIAFDISLMQQETLASDFNNAKLLVRVTNLGRRNRDVWVNRGLAPFYSYNLQIMENGSSAETAGKPKQCVAFGPRRCIDYLNEPSEGICERLEKAWEMSCQNHCSEHDKEFMYGPPHPIPNDYLRLRPGESIEAVVTVVCMGAFHQSQTVALIYDELPPPELSQVDRFTPIQPCLEGASMIRSPIVSNEIAIFQ